MHSRALKVTFAALALSGVLLVGCKRVVKGNTPITGDIPTTTTTVASTTTTKAMTSSTTAAMSSSSSTPMAAAN